MRRGFKVIFMVVLSIVTLTACKEADTTPVVNEDGLEEIETLTVQFVPSREPNEIITVTKPLAQLLKDNLLNHGFVVKNVDISVGTNYEAVGQGLSAGTIDIGFIPGGTFVLYDDGADVILTSTRSGLDKDFDEPSKWNDGLPTNPTEEQVSFYRSLILAGPSEKGRQLADKVNNGEDLTWDDLDGAKWSIMSSSSSAGYIYPTIWLREKFDGRGITDLSQVVQADSYTSSFARLAAEQVDVMVVYADGRRDNETAWNEQFGCEGSIWEDVNVIGVTPPIFNDTISVSKTSPNMSEKLKAALQDVFITLGKTEEGQEIISFYSHEGYKEATSKDYDVERKAQELMKELAQ